MRRVFRVWIVYRRRGHVNSSDSSIRVSVLDVSVHVVPSLGHVLAMWTLESLCLIARVLHVLHQATFVAKLHVTIGV